MMPLVASSDMDDFMRARRDDICKRSKDVYTAHCIVRPDEVQTIYSTSCVLDVGLTERHDAVVRHEDEAVRDAICGLRDKLHRIAGRLRKQYRLIINKHDIEDDFDPERDVDCVLYVPLCVDLDFMALYHTGHKSDFRRPANHWVLVVINLTMRSVTLCDPLNNLATRKFVRDLFIEWLTANSLFDRLMCFTSRAAPWKFYHFERSYQVNPYCGYYVGFYFDQFLRNVTFESIVTSASNCDSKVMTWKMSTWDPTIRSIK